jgi:hypothetical protein
MLRNLHKDSVSDRLSKWTCVTALRGTLMLGLTIFSTGCRAKDRARETRLYNRITQNEHAEKTPPGKMATKASDTITLECEHGSYANVSKGLIAAEVGLHEDVFALRDRVSFAANAYGLDEALRLEALLRAEVDAGGHPTDQTNCIEQFAEHLQSLTDPLVEADKEQKDLDISAFNDAKKQAEEEKLLEQKQESEIPPGKPH